MGMVYHVDLIQTLQVGASPGHTLGGVIKAVPRNPAAIIQPHFSSPFSRLPRPTASSSASTYHSPVVSTNAPSHPSDAASASAPLSATASVSAFVVSEGRTEGDISFSGSVSWQPLSNHPLLGPDAPPSSSSAGQSVTAEYTHGLPRHAQLGNMSQSNSSFQSGSMTSSDSARQTQCPGHLAGGGHALGQSSLQHVSSPLGPVSPTVTVEGSEGSESGPVQALAVVRGRVLTSCGSKATAPSLGDHFLFREWSADGALLATHPCCSLGATFFC